MIGCFKHWMVTLVAEKLRRQCIWEIYISIRANYISNLSPNHTLQLTTRTSVRKSLQVHLKIMMKLGDSQMFSGYYICKILVGRYGLWSIHSGCLIQLAIDNLTNVSLAWGNHAVVKTTNLFLQWRVYTRSVAQWDNTGFWSEPCSNSGNATIYGHKMMFFKQLSNLVHRSS